MKKIVIEENGVVFDYSNHLCGPDGTIINTTTGNIRQTSKDKDGYHYLTLHRDGKRKYFRLHRIVAHLYCENDDPKNNTIVHHIDNDRDNNHYTNLMWTTVSFNTEEGYRTGNADTKGEKHSQAKLTNKDVIEICGLLKEGKLSQREIGNLYGVGASTIGMIKTRTNWTHITKDYDF